MFWWLFLASNGKNACKNYNNLPKSTRTLGMRFSYWSYKKMIHLPGVLVTRKGRYGLICFWGPFLDPNPSKHPKTARKLDTKFIHKFY
jgi:hypothetical protein